MKDLFKEYDPVKNSIFRVMDNDGVIINAGWNPDMEDEKILKAYQDMLFARTLDQMIVSYQRQGRVYTYPPNLGQEAVSVGMGMVMRDEDWLVPAFRELGAYLAKGVTLEEIFLYHMGNEDGSNYSKARNMLPNSVPISSQLLHAVGIGYAIRYNKEDKVVFAVCGDGGTSEGDFHEALNFASVWKAPVLFVVQNNQYAISVPVRKQTASINLAVKSMSYGIPGIKVDGNDLLAMYRVFQYASDFVRKNSMPVLIEAFTYRKGAHTTSDDPTRYRTGDEEAEWDKTDPVRRLKAFLMNKKLWSEKQDQEVIAQYRSEIDRRFIALENRPPYRLDDMFTHLYADMPDDLTYQKMEYEKFLTWKQARK